MLCDIIVKKMNYLKYPLILVMALLSVAAIYKEEDPMGDTQTNPIGYNDKMEEIKQGVKEAPKPSFQLIPKEKFLIDSNLEKDKPKSTAVPDPSVFGEELPEDFQYEAEDIGASEEVSEPDPEVYSGEASEAWEEDGEPSGEGETAQEEEDSGTQDDWWNTAEEIESNEFKN